jgi:hypothetical protein
MPKKGLPGKMKQQTKPDNPPAALAAALVAAEGKCAHYTAS